jgi:hypothetical protein
MKYATYRHINTLEISYICTSGTPASRAYYCLHLTQMYCTYLFLYPATLMMNVSVKETASPKLLAHEHHR